MHNAQLGKMQQKMRVMRNNYKLRIMNCALICTLLPHNQHLITV